MIKAVIFDMDGLLVDSEPIWHKSRIDAFGAERLRWTDADQTRIMGTSTRGWADFLVERLDHAFTADQVIDLVLDQMVLNYRAHTPLMPGARAAVDQLGALYPLGLASGSPYRLIEAVFEYANWGTVFQEVLSTDDLAHGKPAPDVYLEVARRMHVQPEHIAIFEDSANGILAGHAAGVRVIAVPSHYLRPPQDALDKADLVIESLEDFSPEMLAAW